MKAYKLTKQDMTTHGGCKWTVGEWKETSGKGELCGPGWLHYYSDPLLAVLLNPIHAHIENPRLWEIEIDGYIKSDHGLKYGSTRMRLVRKIDLPEITTEQRIAFAILCAKRVYDDPAFNQWADSWLNKSDRSAEAAARAAAAAAWAARAAAWAAEVAAWAARAAAWAAEVAAEAAAEVAAEVAAEAAELDLIALAKQAMEY